MDSKELARYLVLGSALAGLTVGAELRASTVQLTGNGLSGRVAVDSKAAPKPADKHACKGLNACKNQGNCKAGDNGCAGKNSCKGKGGCASKEYHHECKGQNACKGQGAGGKNECKGKGACKVPAPPPAS